ncbi:MAG TPA: hypothetical protein VFA27_00490 [Vicinamibacterales bacterium]|nr:hypothetical protein [Vicinamibacterales bacterium]
MKFLRTTVIALSAFGLVGSTAWADVKVTLQNGRVSIVAKDATVRQILTEWARVGQTKIVNVERIPGGPQTIELTNVPETEALDVLLRSVSGFIAAPRTTPAEPNASQFDRIVVMPTAAAPRPAVNAAAPPPTPTMMPQPMPVPADDDVDDERPQAPVAMPPGAPRGPVFNRFDAPQVVNPRQGVMPQPFNPAQPQMAQPQPQQPSATPTAPFGGVAVPGMVAPAPAQPQQPGQPGQPVRRPNGIEGA